MYQYMNKTSVLSGKQLQQAIIVEVLQAEKDAPKTKNHFLNFRKWLHV